MLPQNTQRIAGYYLRSPAGKYYQDLGYNVHGTFGSLFTAQRWGNTADAEAELKSLQEIHGIVAKVVRRKNTRLGKVGKLTISMENNNENRSRKSPKR